MASISTYSNSYHSIWLSMKGNFLWHGHFDHIGITCTCNHLSLPAMVCKDKYDKNVSRSFISQFVFKSRNDISNAKINKNVDFGLPWRASLLSITYLMVFLLLMAQDSWLFKRVLIPETKETF